MPNGDQDGTKTDPKRSWDLKLDPCAKLRFLDRFWMHLGAAQGSTLVPKSVKVPWKSNQKVCPKSYVEQILILIKKSSQLDAKIGSKVEQTCRTNRNLRFLCFCKVYNVKFVFWDD